MPWMRIYLPIFFQSWSLRYLRALGPPLYLGEKRELMPLINRIPNLESVFIENELKCHCVNVVVSE